MPPSLDDASFDSKLLKPSEVALIWNSPNPKQELMPMINRYIELRSSQDSTFNSHDQHENWWEQDEKNLLAEFILQQLTFAYDSLALQANPTEVARIVNIFVDLADLRRQYFDSSYNLESKFQQLRLFLND